jgi:YbbR domain-containing protein
MKNKIIYGLLSVVIAFGLWLYVITVISPESEATFYNVPVVLENEAVLKENGLMVDEEKDFFVTLVLSGNRSDLNRLKSSDIMVVANLGRISKAGPQTLPYDISIPGGNNSITVVSSSPETITVNIAEWSTKEVDIKLKPVGTVPKDYIVDEKNSELNHNTVTITGPKDVLDRIAMATVEVDVTGQTQTISQKYRLTFRDAEE